MRTILATFFDRKTPAYVVFWNNLARQLRQRGMRLVLLTHQPCSEYLFDNHYIFYLDQVRPLAGEAVLDDAALRRLREHEGNGGRVGDVPGLDARLQTLARFVQANIREYRPALMLNWCGLDTVAHVIRLVAEGEGVPMAVLERGLFSDSLLLEEEGIFGLSKPAGQMEEAPPGFMKKFRKAYYAAKTEKWPQGKRLTSRKDMLSLCPGNGAERILLFAGSNDHSSGAYDSAIQERAYSALVRNSYDALFRLSDELSRMEPGCHVIFKPHPKDHTFRSHEGRARELSNVTVVTDLDVFGAIEWCDACVVVTSTVMVDAMLMGKPLIVLGNTIFDKLSSGMRLADFDQLAGALDRPVDDDLYARLIHYLCTSYLYTLGNPWIERAEAALADRLGEMASASDAAEPGLATRLGLWWRQSRTFRQGWRHG